MTATAIKILAIILAVPLIILLVIGVLAWYGTIFVFAVIMWAAYLPMQILAYAIAGLVAGANYLIDRVK